MRKLGLILCYICFAQIVVILWKDITNTSLDNVTKSWEIGCSILILAGTILLTGMMNRNTR